ncbi:molybdenum ABC transporter ATP-binding protein [Cereibacter sphaeroides]|uniref:molybdenum ABC transporter ATP-binding protein n=1 Tax=Cereibacter sphaeroides TaxID=1063 RepID=UPI001F3EA37B|nr:molybdenum ABC transporter ATP-binding protein [Cereibacter sphaeroides]MCE6958479.1 molybdenum ABC transporter ATP-binding protein [Cereibacter sphaeroides]MCE6972684.1 molybdenum ABC transporter ATP-binding protein [Cereibacter sphaeroides]
MIEAGFRGCLGSFDIDASFTVPGEGVTALFGPSGCGKTTVLRGVAGLLRLPQGSLRVNGETWQEGRRFLPPHRRAIGYVFQEASLFPHLSVDQNLRFGLRRSKGEVRIGTDEVVDLLGIAPLFDRPVPSLSGGERQRVAIGRALLSQPRLLLMDEPLSALDRFSKDEILPYLERLHATLSIPVLYVSHDIAEVERLADTLVLMEAGRVRAAGPIADLLADPTLPLIHMPEPAAVIEGEVIATDPAYGLTDVRVPGGVVTVPGDLGPHGTRRRLRIPASDVSLGRHAALDTTILNALPARIEGAEPAGNHQITVRLRLGPDGQGAALLSRVSRKSWDRLALKPGDLVVARLKAVALAEPAQAPAARADRARPPGQVPQGRPT